MPNRTDAPVSFGKLGRRVVAAAFDGGDIVSDGGALLVKLVDERIGLTRAAARVLAPPSNFEWLLLDMFET